MNCDEHFAYVASSPGVPGAHASCVHEARWLVEFAAEEMACGSTLRLVTCNEAAKLLKEYVEWRDKQPLPQGERSDG